MKKLFKFKYLKLALLIIAIISAYIIFTNPNAYDFLSALGFLSYFGVFIAGILFSFGFTAPYSVGFFLLYETENILLAGIIGGLGAMLADLTIFSIIRFSFMDEFNKLKKTRLIKKLSAITERNYIRQIKIYLAYIFAGIIIASPLPDEIGVTMLSGLTKIKPLTLSIISFILNTIGIIVLLLI